MNQQTIEFLNIAKLLLLIVCQFFIGNLLAQSAEELYQDLGYKAAIPLLENKDNMSLKDMVKIANSYRLNHEVEYAKFWYAQVIEQSKEPIHLLYYAQALQSNKDFELAKTYYRQYQEATGVTGIDQRGAQMIAAIENLDGFKHAELSIKNEQAINSEKLEFSPTYYQNGIVFVSTQDPKKKKKKKKLKEDKALLDLWTNDNYMTLYYATRNEKDSLNESEVFSSNISSKFHEGPVTFNKLGDRIFFCRNHYHNGKKSTDKKGVLKMSIYTARKAGDDWVDVTALDFNTTDYEEVHPSLSADGTMLYFASDRPGGFGGMDIYRSVFSGGQWNEPVNLGDSINTPGNEVFPFVHEDGTLYYASNGWGGLGGLDIFSTIELEENNWEKPVNVGTPFNSTKDDFGLILNITGTEGYFSSARDGGQGRDDIYHYTIPDKNWLGRNKIKKKSCPTLNGTALNDKYGNSIVDARVRLISFCSGEEEEVFTDEKGVFTFPCVPCQCDYMLIAEKDNFETIRQKVSTLSDDCRANTKIEKTLHFNFKEMDIATAAIEPAEIKNNLKPIPKNQQQVIAEDELTIAVGETIELKNVYYDFDEYYIRESSTQALDWVAHLMTIYPSLTIELLAHTDARGTNQYNNWLSKKRATAAVEYISQKGISKTRMQAIGMGEDQLRNNCKSGVTCTEKEHQFNRRTEIRIRTFDQQNIKVRYLDDLFDKID